MLKVSESALRLNSVLLSSVVVGVGALSATASATTTQAAAVGISEMSSLQDSPNRQGLLVPANKNQLAQVTIVPLTQVTSVSQLSDVRPTDWAFQALQSLVERYGCIAGYPDRTYRGDRALTRYEFAAGLSACLDRVNELIAAGTADLVKKEDLDTLNKFQEEFAAELAMLRGRVDTLEARTATLEKQPFFTTTKLNTEVIFVAAGVSGGKAADRDTNSNNNPDLQDNLILGDRVRLIFNTSFVGTDRLRVRLQSKNITPFTGNVTGTNMTRLAVDSNNNNQFEIDQLYYRFRPEPKTTVTVSATGTEFSDIIYSINPYLESSGDGAISRFGRYSPIYRGFGAGATIEHKFSQNFELTLGYLAGMRLIPPIKMGFSRVTTLLWLSCCSDLSRVWIWG